MLRTLALAAAVGMMSALIVADVSATPLAQGKQAVEYNDTTLVRDGCGPGRRFSNSRGRCVAERNDPVVPLLREIIRPRRANDGCGRGFRFSNSRGRCVRI